MAKEVTFRGKLVARKVDWMGYTTYVFENMEPLEPALKYIMCTQFPNWNQGFIEDGDEGFVTVRYVNAGIDTWFDGTQYVPYRNTDVHFIKFLKISSPPEDVTLTL